MKRTILLAILLGIETVGSAQLNSKTITDTCKKEITINKNECKNLSALNSSATTNSFVELMQQSEVANDIRINHKEFSLSYNPKYRLATWLSYVITKEMLMKSPRFGKSEKFKRDPKVKKLFSAIDEDYRNSEYVRGRLCPTADMAHSENSMEETYYYSNISPHKIGFNTGIWQKLENQVRTWTIENERLLVVTGPVLKIGNVIEDNNLFVPKYYYKVILDYDLPEIKCIGFIIPNEWSSEDLSHFAVSVDNVESLTGIDFFPSLPEDQEKAIEASCDLETWGITSISNNKSKSTEKP